MTDLFLRRFSHPVIKNIVLLIARLFVGGLFTLSGYYKLFDTETQQKMRETLTEGNIPFVDFSLYFVSGSELIFGFLLLTGLLTRFSAIVLIIISAVALFTVQIHAAEGDSTLYWLSSVLFLPDVHIIGTCLLLLAYGAGRISVDYPLGNS